MQRLRFTLTLLAALCFFGSLQAQYTLYISGNISDLSSNPIASHNVDIHLDSLMGGFTYTSTVVTNGNGDYADTVTVPFLVSQGVGYAATQDCNSQWHFSNFSWTINASIVTGVDFQICNGTQNTCNASFGHSATGNTLNFTDWSTGSSAITSWSWAFGDGNTSTQQNPSHTYAAAGTYAVTLTITTAQGCTDTWSDSVSTQNNTLPCQASYYHYPDSNGQYSIILVNTSTGQNPTYYWTFGDGNTSTAAFPQHTYAGPGTYVVCVTITAQGGGQSCTSTYCDSITVTQKINAPFSINVISPTTNVVAPQPVALQLWPNPTSGQLNATVAPTESGMANAMLIDAQGRQAAQLMRQELSAGKQDLRWDVSHLPTGIYFLNLQIGTQQSVRKVLITK